MLLFPLVLLLVNPPLEASKREPLNPYAMRNSSHSWEFRQENAPPGWVKIERGSRKGQFRFTPDRKLSYGGRPFVNLKVRPTVNLITISPASPNNEYALCITKDDQNSAAYLLHLQKLTATRLKMDAPPLNWVAWSPDMTHIVLGSYYEADMKLYSVSLSSINVRPITVNMGIKTSQNGSPLEESIYGIDELQWVNPQTFRLPVKIYCSRYNDTKCDEGRYEKVLRSLWVDVNVSTLAVSLKKPRP